MVRRAIKLRDWLQYLIKDKTNQYEVAWGNFLDNVGGI